MSYNVIEHSKVGCVFGVVSEGVILNHPIAVQLGESWGWFMALALPLYHHHIHHIPMV